MAGSVTARSSQCDLQGPELSLSMRRGHDLLMVLRGVQLPLPLGVVPEVCWPMGSEEWHT